MVDARKQVKRDKDKKIYFFEHAVFECTAKKPIENPVSIYLVMKNQKHLFRRFLH
jgi:hypothetical protein